MDNGENKITPESVERQAVKTPENWAPENPEHNLSELGSNAMGNAIISSTPDEETTPAQSDEPFKITDVFPAGQSDSKTKNNEEPKLVFNPSDITPQKEGISPSTEAAIHRIEDLIIRGDDPRDAYTNYQALKKAVAGQSSAVESEKK